MYTKAFLKDLLERVISTFVQAFIPALGLGAVVDGSGFDLRTAPWLAALSIAGGAAFLSLVKGIAAGLKNPNTGASLGTAVPSGQEDEGTQDVAGDGDPGEVVG